MSHFSPLMRISYLSCLSPGLITDINPTANLVFDSAISLLGSYDTSFRLHLSSQDASLGLAVKPPPCCCRLQFGRFPTLCPFRQSAFPWDFVHVSRTKKLADSPKPKPTNSPAAFSLVDLFHYIFLSLLVSFFLTVALRMPVNLSTIWHHKQYQTAFSYVSYRFLLYPSTNNSHYQPAYLKIYE